MGQETEMEEGETKTHQMRLGMLQVRRLDRRQIEFLVIMLGQADPIDSLDILIFNCDEMSQLVSKREIIRTRILGINER